MITSSVTAQQLLNWVITLQLQMKHCNRYFTLEHRLLPHTEALPYDVDVMTLHCHHSNGALLPARHTPLEGRWQRGVGAELAAAGES